MLELEGGKAVRRLSGGGAVYHDMGNLNFTFITHKADYDTAKQTDVVLKAVSDLGIKAEKTGRNDLTTADGRKFSGHAYYKNGDRCYHHGTIMVDVDSEALSRYLTVSADKLRGKGVDSVRSRVVNLIELEPSITIDSLKNAMINAFEDVYGMKSQTIPENLVKADEIAEKMAFLGSDSFRLGSNMSFDWTAKKRFPWGGAEISLAVSGGVINNAVCYSDAMREDVLSQVADAIKSSRFEAASVCERIINIPSDEEGKNILNDISAMLKEEML
ncbi:MAG: lipoate--protein ligase [Clostridia bacterium]|nr:lipoate--protein ligase [Clostridia bacterium]